VKIQDEVEVTAEEIVTGPRKPRSTKLKIQLFKVRLVKERVLRFPVTRIGSSEDLVKIARSELGHLPHEEIIAIGLSGKNEPVGVVKISQGGIGGAAMTPADVIRPLLAMGALAFVLAHNHPSGDPSPSQDDIAMTKRLKTAADCVNLHFLDHVIIGGIRGGTGYSSLRDLGIF
jgi:DNA repair protein RadC